MVFAIGFSISYVFMTLYAVSSGIVSPGSYFIASSVCQVVARIVAGKFADRENVLPIILVGGIASCLSYGGLALTTNATIYLLSGALFGIGTGMIGPVMNRLAVMNAAPQRRGAASATYYISSDLGNGIGGMLWGSLIDAGTYQSCFSIVTGWMTAALVICLGYLLYRSRRQKRLAGDAV
jgi:predicted MFS family arabinose efflux permease